MAETWSPNPEQLFVKPEGEGWTITGYKEGVANVGGSKYTSATTKKVQVPIYTRLGAPAAPAPAPAPATPDSIAQAQAAVEAAQNRQPASYPQAADPMAGVNEALNAQAAQYQEQMSALEALMVQQQSQYESQMAEAERQQQLMVAQAAESQRQAEALQRAFVPNLEPTAAAPTIGDSRQQGSTATRTAAANTLSTLSILTGLGGTTSAGVSATAPLAGLQIA